MKPSCSWLQSTHGNYFSVAEYVKHTDSHFHKVLCRPNLWYIEADFSTNIYKLHLNVWSAKWYLRACLHKHLVHGKLSSKSTPRYPRHSIVHLDLPHFQMGIGQSALRNFRPWQQGSYGYLMCGRLVDLDPSFPWTKHLYRQAPRYQCRDVYFRCSFLKAKEALESNVRPNSVFS